VGWLARRWHEVVSGNGTSTADATGNVLAWECLSAAPFAKSSPAGTARTEA
jgi:hypothetical protein